MRVDGGASTNDWLMQFESDVLGLPVRRPAMAEATARGAAGLAGWALGFWQSPEEFADAHPEERVFAPNASAPERKRRLAGWERALRTARTWAESPGAEE